MRFVADLAVVGERREEVGRHRRASDRVIDRQSEQRVGRAGAGLQVGVEVLALRVVLIRAAGRELDAQYAGHERCAVERVAFEQRVAREQRHIVDTRRVAAHLLSVDGTIVGFDQLATAVGFSRRHVDEHEDAF